MTPGAANGVPVLGALALLVQAGCAGVSLPLPSASSAPDASPPGTRGSQGFLSPRWDPAEEHLLLEVPPPDQDVLYYVSLPGGLGSNAVGLDRGGIGFRALIRFRPAGRKVLVVAPNLAWRSTSENPFERRAVEDAFASSVIASLPVAAREDGRILVDATQFFLRDPQGIARKLEDTGQGTFSLSTDRSAILPERLAAFPDNSEVEVLLTFESERPGPEVRSTAAVPTAVTLRAHHSFVRLPATPDPPRPFDPRCGFFPVAWNDFARPLDEPLRTLVIPRHRLDPEHPIVYYVDRAAPEPVRSALLAGARYWIPAFEAAGFPQGFRVELLPPDADPQDVRFNVIQWVPRSTRGWSYGDTVVDPRNGRILKGHVTLGALRVRQDVRIFEALLSPHDPDGATDPRVLETALARIRQLAAHEVGHTLGLAHNFAASLDGQASVMDYPAPWVRLDEAGELDLSAAYAPGIGPWDVFAIRYGYTRWPTAEAEAAGLTALLREAPGSYLTDRDARGPDRAHPRALLWDTGPEPLSALESCYAVRGRALARFSAAILGPGRPFFQLERALGLIYFFHRYQLEATVRQLGGVAYRYAVVGRDSDPGIEPVPATLQRQALELVLESLSPSFLALPAHVTDLIAPPPPGFSRSPEDFRTDSLLFDPLDAAASAADLSLGLLLNPERARRLADQPLRDAELPSLADVLEALVSGVWSEPEEPPAFRAVRNEVQTRTLEHLFQLARSERVPTRVRETVFDRLQRLRQRLELENREGAHAAFERERLRRFFEFPQLASDPTRPGRIPPGPPIGARAWPALGDFDCPLR